MCSSYQDITPLSLPGKASVWVLERQPYRSCPGRGTVDQLFTLAGLLEWSWGFEHPVNMCFGEGPWPPRSLVEPSVGVSLRNWELCQMHFHSVLGSGPFSPTLLVIFKDRISRRRLREGDCRVGHLSIASLVFADDVVPSASPVCDLQHALGHFSAECEAARMTVCTSEPIVLCWKTLDWSLKVGEWATAPSQGVQVSCGADHEWG